MHIAQQKCTEPTTASIIHSDNVNFMVRGDRRTPPPQDVCTVRATIPSRLRANGYSVVTRRVPGTSDFIRLRLRYISYRSADSPSFSLRQRMRPLKSAKKHKTINRTLLTINRYSGAYLPSGEKTLSRPNSAWRRREI